MKKYLMKWFNKKVKKQLDIKEILDFKIYEIKGKIFVKGSLDEKQFETEKEAKIYITKILSLDS